MFKLSLILMLSSMQLLAGSSKDVYLCVSSDGSFCCLDAGPASCTCCHHEVAPSPCQSGCCGSSSEKCESQPCHHDDDHSCPEEHESPTPNDSPSIASGPCSCTHQLVSMEQAASVRRSSVTIEVLDAWQLCACLPAVFYQHSSADFDVRPFRQGPPPMPDAALVVLSTVVICC